MNDYKHGLRCKDYSLIEVENQSCEDETKTDAKPKQMYTLSYRTDLIPEKMSPNFVRGLVETYLHIDAKEYKVKFSVVKEVEQRMDDWLESRAIKFTKKPMYMICMFAKNITKYLIEHTECLDFLAVIYEPSTPETRLERPYNVFLSMCDDLQGNELSRFKVVRKDSRAILPSKKRASDVGYDLTIISKVKDLGSVTALYDTGLIIQPPPGYYIEVVPRSSLSKSGYLQVTRLVSLIPII